MKKVTSMKTTRVIGAALAAASMYLPAARTALADAAPEKGIVAFKYLNYKDWQPGQDRMNINAYSVRAMTPIAGKWAIDFTGTIDSVSGSSPKFHSYFDTASGASKINSDTRKSADLSVTRYFSNSSVTAGTSFSKESDYISRSVSLQGSLSTPSKNTTVTLGGSITTDSIFPTAPVDPTIDKGKKIYAVLLGLTQIVSKNDIVQLNLSRSVGTGYFRDPYRDGDNRPSYRNYSTIMTRWNHYFESTEGVTHLAYRYYDDTFGIKSHTFSAEYVQPLSNGFSIMPSARYYSQSAAYFYVPVSPAEVAAPYDYGSSIPAGAYNYSLDSRLSAFGAVTLGIKVSKKIAHDWIMDVRYDRYMQRYDWGINGKGDANLAHFNAGFIQAGLSKEF